MIGVLASYHYWRDNQMERLFGDWRPFLFADSGAFSAYSVGAEIDVHAYAAWLDRHRERIDIAASLDVIGNAEATAENTRILEDQGHVVVPVFHVGESWEWLDRWCESHAYVALGGMVGHKARQGVLLRWMVECMIRARPHGTVFHGFGMTSMTSAAQLPLFSLDSSSWKTGVRYGTMMLWDDLRGMVQVAPRGRAQAAELLRSYDLSADVFGQFGVGSEGKSAEQRLHEDDEFRRVGLESAIRFERWWHPRHAPIEPRGLDLPAGPHVFLVVINELDTRAARPMIKEMA